MKVWLQEAYFDLCKKGITEQISEIQKLLVNKITWLESVKDSLEEVRDISTRKDLTLWQDDLESLHTALNIEFTRMVIAFEQAVNLPEELSQKFDWGKQYGRV